MFLGIVDWKFWIGNLGLEIWDWEFGIGNLGLEIVLIWGIFELRDSVVGIYGYSIYHNLNIFSKSQIFKIKKIKKPQLMSNPPNQLQISTSSAPPLTEQMNKQIIRKVSMLSIFIFILTLTYSSFCNVLVYMHQKYEHKGYGESYLTANTICSLVSYLLTPVLIDKWDRSSKTMLWGCLIGYFCNVSIPALCSFYEGTVLGYDFKMEPSFFRFWLQIGANCVGGASAGVLWVLHGVYMATYCRRVRDSSKGRFFGVANGILNARLILSPFITMLGFGLGNQAVYFGLLSLICLTSIPILHYTIPPINLSYNSPINLSDKSPINLSDKSLPSPSPSPSSISINYLLQFLRNYYKLGLILPLSMLSGFVYGFISSSLSHLLPVPVHGENNDFRIAVALFFFGIGNVLGGYFSGFCSDRFCLKNAVGLGILFVTVGSLSETLCLISAHTLSLGSLVGLLFGLSSSYISSLVTLICTIYFQGNAFSFSIHRQISNISFILYQWFVALSNNNTNMIFNMELQGLALIPFGVGALFCVRRFCRAVGQRKEGQGEGEGEVEGEGSADFEKKGEGNLEISSACDSNSKSDGNDGVKSFY